MWKEKFIALFRGIFWHLHWEAEGNIFTFRSERICSVDSWKFSVFVMKSDRLLHVVLNTKRPILPVPLLIQSGIHRPAVTWWDRWTRLLTLSGLLVIVRVKVKPCFHRPALFTHPMFHYVAAVKVARMRYPVEAEWHRSECPHTSVTQSPYFKTHRRYSERLFTKNYNLITMKFITVKQTPSKWKRPSSSCDLWQPEMKCLVQKGCIFTSIIWWEINRKWVLYE